MIHRIQTRRGLMSSSVHLMMKYGRMSKSRCPVSILVISLRRNKGERAELHAQRVQTVGTSLKDCLALAPGVIRITGLESSV
jgi:hypothetical protein